MDKEDEKGDEDKGNSFNINRWNVKLPKQTLNKSNILLISFFWMYSLESKIPNEYPTIFVRLKTSQMNVRIYFLWKNLRIFTRMNIFVNQHLNIFEYPNICYTLDLS